MINSCRVHVRSKEQMGRDGIRDVFVIQPRYMERIFFIYLVLTYVENRKLKMTRYGIRDVGDISVGNHRTVNNCTHAYLRTYLKEKETHRK